MRRDVCRVGAAMLLIASFLAACGSDPEPAPVYPADRCVSEDEQRTHGVNVAVPGSEYDVDGLVYGDSSTAIVFANQIDWKLCGWKPFAESFARRGYLTAVFNYTEVTAPTTTSWHW